MMKEMKIIAFYLPQFHETEENNKWWGKGFTEWTNVKSGRPLFKGHYQPKVPLNNNYYDLSNIAVMDEQAKLAKKYGVDGFCFYHYWFNGKKLLNKPLEELVQNTDIDLSYCLSWANETWSRRWNGNEKEILIKQEYGGEKEWEEHIQYLLQFFMDKRYLRIDNKPVLLLYRALEIPECQKMVTYWDFRLKQEGFNGIYIIETLNGAQTESHIENSDALAEFEPMFTIKTGMNIRTRIYRYLFNHLKLYRFGFKDYISYDMIWKTIFARKRNTGKKTYYGAFPEWDNVARRGKAGLIIRGGNPEKFEGYFKKQYDKSIEAGNEFLFINAWNEWGEGAYLEADEKHKLGYLEAIKRVKGSTEQE